MMARSDDDERVLSHKELLKLRRRAAYQKAKQQRADDPKYLAMKEAARKERRDAYQKAKQRRKAELELEKAQQKAEQAQKRQSARAEADAELWKLVTCTAKGSTPTWSAGSGCASATWTGRGGTICWSGCTILSRQSPSRSWASTSICPTPTSR